MLFLKEEKNISKYRLEYKLPGDLKPYFYEIFIKTYFNRFEQPNFYVGNVLIKFKCIKNTSKLILHGHENLEINNSTVELYSLNDVISNTTKKLEIYSFNHKTQLLVFDFYNHVFVEKKSYMVNISFKGHIKDDNIGLYRTEFVDVAGEKK